MEANTDAQQGIRACVRVAEKALEGDDRQSHTDDSRIIVRLLLQIYSFVFLDIFRKITTAVPLKPEGLGKPH